MRHIPRPLLAGLMRRYCGSMAMAGLLALAHGVVCDVALERISFLIRTEMPMGVVIDLDRASVFTCVERPTQWLVSGDRVETLNDLRAQAIESMLARNLAPAFEAVLHFVQLNPRVLWSTAAEQIDLLYENALDGLPAEEFAPFEADRNLLLFGERLPGWCGPNPLRDLLEWEDVHDPQFSASIASPSHVLRVLRDPWPQCLLPNVRDHFGRTTAGALALLEELTPRLNHLVHIVARRNSVLRGLTFGLG